MNERENRRKVHETLAKNRSPYEKMENLSKRNDHNFSRWSKKLNEDIAELLEMHPQSQTIEQFVSESTESDLRLNLRMTIGLLLYCRHAQHNVLLGNIAEAVDTYIHCLQDEI